MGDIARLDYDGYPPGQEWRKGQEYPPTVHFDRARIWAAFKRAGPPPGLRPHPWADLGEPFRHAFVTPLGFTLPETVGVSSETALAAAWRWYDFGLALVNTGKPGFSWPGVLDAHPSDLFGKINNLVIREEAIGHG